MSNWQNSQSGGYGPPQQPYQPPYQQPYQQPYRPTTPEGLRLGPMTLADILDNTFRLIKMNWRAIGFVVLVFATPSAILSGIANGLVNADTPNGFRAFFTYDVSDGFTGREGAGYVLGLLQSLLDVMVVVPLVTAVIARLVLATYLRKTISTRDAIKGALKLWPAILGASVLVHLAEIGGAVVFFLPFIALWVLFTAVTPIIAVEESGAVNALNRSLNLLKSRFWPYLGTLVLIFFIRQFVSAIPSLLVAVPALIFDALGIEPLAWLFYALSTMAANLILLPIGSVVATLIYLDARVRTEGFDVQLAAANLPNGGQPQQPQPAPYYPQGGPASAPYPPNYPPAYPPPNPPQAPPPPPNYPPPAPPSTPPTPPEYPPPAAPPAPPPRPPQADNPDS